MIIFCKLGIHDWYITKWDRYRDKGGYAVLTEQVFERDCIRCSKKQRLRNSSGKQSIYTWNNILF